MEDLLSWALLVALFGAVFGIANCEAEQQQQSETARTAAVKCLERETVVDRCRCTSSVYAKNPQADGLEALLRAACAGEDK